MPSSSIPYDIMTVAPSTIPAIAAQAIIAAVRGRDTATASDAMPHAPTVAITASAETARNTAAGVKTRKGAALRATASAPRARSVVSTAAGSVAATSVTTMPAVKSEPSPSRTRATKNRSIPGGCPATWVTQLSSAA